MEPLTELLDKATQLVARDIERRCQLEAGATEGDYRELGENDHN
jgi:hypothetical protein